MTGALADRLVVAVMSLPGAVGAERRGRLVRGFIWFGQLECPGGIGWMS